MVETSMVRRMTVHALFLAPLVAAGLWVFGGPRYALSGAIGLAMTLGNLWLSARIIGAVAERNPQMLVPTGIATFVLGLLALTGVAFALRALEVGYFPVTGFTLIGSHLLLVLWEATSLDAKPQSTSQKSPRPARQDKELVDGT